MKTVVTGGAGFIGSHLIRRLVADGAEVTVIDDLSTGRPENIEGVPVTVAERDLARDDVTDLLRGVDVIFHLAAVPSVPRSVREPLRSHQAAATGTLRLLDAAREAGVRTFVNSSSSSVYGDVASPPMRESMPTVPRSPYAVAKLAAEGYTRVFAQLHGMRTVSLRYFNVFGPRQNPASTYAAAIPRFITAYLRRERPQVFGDGRQSRDFTYVDNVVEANIAAAAAPKLSGESVNIAAGNPRTVLDVLEAISNEFGYSLPPAYAPDRPGDIRDSHADLSVARSLLGYNATVDFQTGLRRTVEFLREASTVRS
ncbi:MAG: NAD-dependent epimerase/dehydratase family protein [Chloroflexi bacterium]|nr:MAG: NAD-dependent epimerase/dehydratase family protein [Chloroflexota bacterium]